MSPKLKLIGNFSYVNHYCNNYNVEFVLTKPSKSTFTGYMTKPPIFSLKAMKLLHQHSTVSAGLVFLCSRVEKKKGKIRYWLKSYVYFWLFLGWTLWHKGNCCCTPWSAHSIHTTLWKSCVQNTISHLNCEIMFWIHDVRWRGMHTPYTPVCN